MEQTNKFKKLAGNSVLFALGNFGSKLISFFMLPLYTAKLSQMEYGTVDLVTTTISLLLPVISLSIFDAVLRFAMDKANDPKKVFTNGLFVTCVGSLLVLIALPILFFMKSITGMYLVIILILQAFQSLFTQFSKAIDKIKVYAFNGMLVSFLTASCNVLFLVFFELGISGYFLSLIIANLVSNIYLFFRVKLAQYVKLEQFDLLEIKKMLIYCAPLIPNGIAWWATNTISRYFILFFIGRSANGIFAVANKIPSLISMLNGIFFQAWQLSVIEEFSNEGKDEYYSKTFRLYAKFLLLCSSGLFLILKPLMRILVSQNFYIAWRYIPALVLSVVYSSFAGFLGNYYAAAKKTGAVFSTTVISALINVVGNLMLIPLVGLQGAGISSAISFFVLWIIRHHDTKKYVKMDIDFKNIFANHIVLFCQIVALFLFEGWILFGIESILCLIIVLVDRELFSLIFKLVGKIVKKKHK